MDITTICKVILCIGILQTYSLYHVDADDGILFEVLEMVEWSKADQTCQKYNGTLFKPNETSFNVSVFSECNFNDDVWVAATYINVVNFESAFKQSDSVIRCEMCTIGERCETTCTYQACGNRCKAVCKYLMDPYNSFLSDDPNKWIEGKQWCSQHYGELGDKIQNASSLFHTGICIDRCLWTRNVILVYFQSTLAQGNDPGECGILDNGTLSFTSCNRYLHPLCERVAKNDLETPRPFSKRNNSCMLMNNTITYTTTTEASRRTNRINATVITSATYGTSAVANEIPIHTTTGLNKEWSSLLVPVGTTTSRNDLEDSPHNSDTGIIIGSVIGSVVFLMLTVLVIICARRKVLQRTGKMKSKDDIQNMKMHTTGTTHEPIAPYQGQGVPLESESGSFAHLESKCEGSRSDIVRQKSSPVKSAYMIDQEGSKFNYATVKKTENVNSNNLTININYVSYDHLNDIRERRDDNVAAKVYDNRF